MEKQLQSIFWRDSLESSETLSKRCRFDGRGRLAVDMIEGFFYKFTREEEGFVQRRQRFAENIRLNGCTHMKTMIFIPT